MDFSKAEPWKTLLNSDRWFEFRAFVQAKLVFIERSLMKLPAGLVLLLALLPAACQNKTSSETKGMERIWRASLFWLLNITNLILSSLRRFNGLDWMRIFLAGKSLLTRPGLWKIKYRQLNQEFFMKSLTLIALAATLNACVATANYTHTADDSFPPFPIDCKFKILSALPDNSYKEIGVVNVDPVVHQGGGMSAPRNPEEFRKLIQSDVCKAGGELVIGDVNGLGQYIRGTVYRKH